MTGVDLTEEYCRAAEMLTRRVGLNEQVTFRTRNALDIPFENAAFDAVWIQHSTMNIMDKGKLVDEIRRVLRPGGRYALHEICAGPRSGAILVPVPWAERRRSASLCRPNGWPV